MEGEKVLVRPREDGTYEEAAVVTRVDKKVLHLAMPDGSTVQRERASGELTPHRWSFVHLLRVHPDRVSQALIENSIVVVKQLLLESSNPLRAAEVKSKLQDAADPAVIDRVWSAVRPLLAQDPDVALSEGRSPTYRLRRSDNPSFRQLFPVETTARLVPEVDPASEPAEPDDRAADLVPSLAVTHAEPGTATPPASSPEPAAEAAGAPDEQQADGPAVAPLRQRLLEADPALGRAEADRLTTRPLALGSLASRLPAGVLRTIVEGLDHKDRLTLALAVGASRSRSALQPIVEAATPGDHARTLAAGLDEVQSAQSEQADLKRRLLEVAQRADDAGGLSASGVVRLARAFMEAPRYLDGIAWSLDRAADVLDVSRSRAVLDEQELALLATASRLLDLDRDGPRARLIVALAAAMPGEDRKARWWDGALAPQLAQVARGRLAATLEQEPLSRTVVSPAVRDFLAATPTRGMAAAVFGWPRALTHHVSGADLARLLGNLATSDPVVAEWVRAVADTERVMQLERALDEARQRMAQVEERARTRDDELQRLRTDLVRTSEQLATARSVDAAESSAHDRQTKIDGVRSLATLAAQVLQSGPATQDVALMRQLEHVVALEGLEPISSAGEEVTFDPTHHLALTRRLLPESPAQVVRGGYTWMHDDDRVVVLKAQVVAVQE